MKFYTVDPLSIWNFTYKFTWHDTNKGGFEDQALWKSEHFLIIG